MPILLRFLQRIVLISIVASFISPVKVFGSNSVPITLADPTVFYYKGVYYLYGTGGDESNNQGFVVHTSTNLKTWSKAVGATNGYALKKGDAFGNAGFWAPQVFHYKGKFYMTYTADEHIAIATSDSPLGPFKQEQKRPIISERKNIDSYVFIDDDGKKFLYHVIVADGGNRIHVAEMEDDFSGIKKNTVTKCIEANTKWENTEQAEWTVTEGPTVIKKNGLYYMIYSANDFRSKDYAIGYAVSTSPMGPWKKYEANPVLSKHNTKMNGSGHGDLFKDAKSNWQYVFHTHFSDTKVGPRKTAIAKAEFDPSDKPKFNINAANFHYLEISKPVKSNK